MHPSLAKTGKMPVLPLWAGTSIKTPPDRGRAHSAPSDVAALASGPRSRRPAHFCNAKKMQQPPSLWCRIFRKLRACSSPLCSPVFSLSSFLWTRTTRDTRPGRHPLF
jgi:hypothetical protein